MIQETKAITLGQLIDLRILIEAERKYLIANTFYHKTPKNTRIAINDGEMRMLTRLIDHLEEDI